MSDRHLRAVRLERGLTQVKAARAVGVSRREWQRWEDGDAVPRLGRVTTIARVLRVEVGEVVTMIAVSQARGEGIR